MGGPAASCTDALARASLNVAAHGRMKVLVDPQELAAAARCALNDADAELLSTSVEPIRHRSVIETTGGLYLARGRARCVQGEHPWSAVLKILVRPVSDCREPADWCYWRREAVVYDSGVVPDRAAGGRLRRPHRLELIEGADEIRLWLEHVPDASSRAWDLPEFERVAHAAGRFAGFGLRRPADRAHQGLQPFLPSVLASGGWWATFMDPAVADETVVGVCGQPGAWRSPAVVDAVDPVMKARVLRLWEERDGLLEMMAQLPTVLCHNDLHRRNVLLPATSEVVAVDWAFCGAGSVGSDLADLVWGTLYYGDTSVTDVAHLERTVLDAYVDGLRAAESEVDPQAVRLSYLLATGLRWAALLPGWIGWMLGGQSGCDPEAVFGRPAVRLRRDWAWLCSSALDRADAARKLSASLYGK